MLNLLTNDPMSFLLTLVALVIAFTVHELAHGLMAYTLGDKTAKHDGRLTLNPIRHIDVLGLLFIMFAGFGWAKPVMVNPSNFRYPKQDMALTAVAGPLSNFAMAFVATIIFFMLVGSMGNVFAIGLWGSFLLTFININLVLGIFNLLPIPPLDGSKLFGSILPDTAYFRFISMGGRFSMLILLVLVVTNTLFPIISSIHGFLFELMFRVGQALFG